MSGFLVGSPLIDPAVKSHNGGTSSLTLDNAGTTNSTLLFISGVAQTAGTDFTVSGVTLSTTTAIPAGTNIATTVQLSVTGTVNVPADLSVATGKIANDAVTLAKMDSGTDGNIISYDASGNPVAVATGSSGEVLTSAGAGAPPTFAAAAGLTLGTEQASTSGTSIDFTGIPTGTKRITVNFEGVSQSGSDYTGVQLGDSGGFESSGYVSQSNYTDQGGGVSEISSTANFVIFGSAANRPRTGAMVFSLKDASNNTWVQTHIILETSAVTSISHGAGIKSLSGELTQISVITTGSNTFDAGSINIIYE